jgi:two-component system sensor histidine kinase KdpD
MPAQRNRNLDYGIALGIVAGALLLSLPLRPQIKIIDVAMLFLLAVVVVASLTRRGPALVSALLATAAFDFFFVPPYGTFAVADAAYWLTFTVMFVVAALMGGLTARLKEAGEEAVEREHQVAELYALSRELSGAGTTGQVVAIARDHLGRAVHAETDLVLAHAGQPQPYSGGFDARVIPIWPDRPSAGVAILRYIPESRIPTDEERRTVRLLLDQVAVALERLAPHPVEA